MYNIFYFVQYLLVCFFFILFYRSGQILFERWTIGLYNVVFTALPPFAMGIFDKVCSAEIMIKYPALYTSQNAQLLNVRVFWIWIGNAVLHSIFLYWMPMFSYNYENVWKNGHNGGFLVLGNMVYTVRTLCNHFSIKEKKRGQKYAETFFFNNLDDIHRHRLISSTNK